MVSFSSAACLRLMVSVPVRLPQPILGSHRKWFVAGEAIDKGIPVHSDIRYTADLDIADQVLVLGIGSDAADLPVLIRNPSPSPERSRNREGQTGSGVRCVLVLRIPLREMEPQSSSSAMYWSISAVAQGGLPEGTARRIFSKLMVLFSRLTIDLFADAVEHEASRRCAD